MAFIVITSAVPTSIFTTCAAPPLTLPHSVKHPPPHEPPQTGVTVHAQGTKERENKRNRKQIRKEKEKLKKNVNISHLDSITGKPNANRLKSQFDDFLII
ncbi:unnamed protein product [Cuscuta epithymum]|uniref:Uncharacterized protein n=1 Tax=Cuscuta epithymum TaxID=186058 RepID=A0AAV0DAV3_9ASTE|nr:unnamed protein product [Cuscuta epithymum]